MRRIFILAFFSSLIFFGLTNTVFAQEIKTDQKLNDSIQNIQCREDRILIINSAGKAALCVKESSVARFTELGWSQIRAEPQNEISVKILNKFERPSSPGHYTIIFKVCTDDQPLRTPKVVASSDSEQRIFNMVKNIGPYSCYNSATLIKSSNPETIVIKVNNQSDSNQKILELEQKINKLKSELDNKNYLLNKLISENSIAHDQIVNIQIDQLTEEIQNLRSELSDKRAEYYNILYSRYTK